MRRGKVGPILGGRLRRNFLPARALGREAGAEVSWPEVAAT